jgi:hypothetical protein
LPLVRMPACNRPASIVVARPVRSEVVSPAAEYHGGLRSPARRPVTADDHGAVLRVWSRRHRDLGRAKNQVACRLHAVLCELVPGGVPEEITAAQATRILERSTPSGVAGQWRAVGAGIVHSWLRRLLWSRARRGALRSSPRAAQCDLPARHAAVTTV